MNFSQDLTREDMEIDDVKTSGILFQIMIIGEATKRLSSEFRKQYSEMPWKQMAGMRDILAHQYDRLDFDLMWNVIQLDIPEMLDKITLLFPEISS